METDSGYVTEWQEKLDLIDRKCDQRREDWERAEELKRRFRLDEKTH